MRERIGGDTLTVGQAVLGICLLYMAVIILISVYQAAVYIALTLFTMLLTFHVYILIYFEIRGFREAAVEPSDIMSQAQRGTIMSLFYATVISFLVLIPCVSTMFIWCWSDFADKFWQANEDSCLSFVLVNFFHHPMMAVNFCCHPFVLFATSRLLRDECYDFVRRLSFRLAGKYDPLNVANS